MSKKRIFPFGYRMQDGKIEIDLQEAELVRQIFQGYSSGKTMPELAASAEGTGISYREGTAKWNKNMVFRILEDQRYLGQEGYPAVIDQEIFDAAAARHREKGRKSSILLPREIRDKLCCPQCGRTLCRACLNQGKVTWRCSDCGWESSWIGDREILRQVTANLNRILTQPELVLIQKEEENHFSLKAMRLTYEINRKLGDPRSDPGQLLGLIQACAQEKYNSCKSGTGHWANDRLSSLLAQHQPSEAFNPALFREIVSKVLITPQAMVSLQLINQVII